MRGGGGGGLEGWGGPGPSEARSRQMSQAGGWRGWGSKRCAEEHQGTLGMVRGGIVVQGREWRCQGGGARVGAVVGEFRKGLLLLRECQGVPMRDQGRGPIKLTLL